ncbi:MAG: N-acyl homoserine lactonase family protein [Streptosporangiaceae bacterium]
MPGKTPDKTTVHILGCGTMHCDLTWLLLQPGRAIADRSNPHKPAEWIECPCHAVVVDHPEGRLLWDTSCPRDWETHWKETGLQEFFPYDNVSEEEYLDSRLRQLDLSVSDFDMVVLSHLHFDHCGNAQLFANSGARMICSKPEYDGAFGFDGAFKAAHIKADYDGLPWETVDGDTELLPGVRVLQTPGHTWGTMSLQVDLADSGPMIFTSDAIYMQASYGPPPVGAGIVYDSLAWLASVEKIRSIAEKTNPTLVFGHDPDQIHDLRLAPQGSYT